MAQSLHSAERAYGALGVPPPRRTFLDRGGSAAPGGHRQPSASSRIGSAATARGLPSSGMNTGGGGAFAAAAADPSDGAKGMLLTGHKIELEDMLQESVSLLKNIYRSKFVFGDHLRFVDPSYSGDTVNQFQLSTPPAFDPSFAGGATNNQQKTNNNAEGSPNPQDGTQQDNSQATAGVREKLRTAEELIKKLYRRNTQLEVENKHLKGEIQHHEKLAGLGRTGSHNMCFVDGHIPNDHPLYSRKLKRRCRSGPPTRTLLRTAVQGYGLKFPPRGQQAPDDAPREEPIHIQQLKRRIHQLTEALVTVQHENEKLVSEKTQRLSLRDSLLKNYLVDRDQQIAVLHASLQDVIGKIQNPMKLTRARQPSAGVNPVVATNNVLKEVNQKLAAQVASLTGEIVAKATASMPHSGANMDSPTSPTRRGTQQHPEDSGVPTPPHPPGARPLTSATASAGNLNRSTMPAAANAVEDTIGARRRELTKRIRTIVDTLPTQKRKQLLLVLAELKQLYDALANSNRSLLTTFEDHKSRTSKEAISLKLQVAMLTDQLRALGVRIDEQELLGAGGADADLLGMGDGGMDHGDEQDP